MPNKKLEKIIKIARDVYNKLGSGFDERVYENGYAPVNTAAI